MRSGLFCRGGWNEERGNQLSVSISNSSEHQLHVQRFQRLVRVHAEGKKGCGFCRVRTSFQLLCQILYIEMELSINSMLKLKEVNSLSSFGHRLESCRRTAIPTRLIRRTVTAAELRWRPVVPHSREELRRDETCSTRTLCTLFWVTASLRDTEAAALTCRCTAAAERKV